MTRRSLLMAGAAAGVAAAGLAAPGTAQAARTKNLLLVGQNGNLNLVTPGGSLLMYYHNGWQNGDASIIGPYHHGDGFQSYEFMASTGVASTYDNLYVCVNSTGVYGYYWDQANQRFTNGGAPQRIEGGVSSSNLKFLISGGYDFVNPRGSIFYTVDTSGRLFWHKYIGIPSEGGVWAYNSGTYLGSGWQNFSYVTASSDGVIWGVTPGGTMYWYRYLYPNYGQGEGWADNSTAVVGSGWRGGTYGYQTVQAGGVQESRSGGYMYMVDRNGNLRWNRHLGYWNGLPSWQYPSNGGKIIGTGWM